MNDSVICWRCLCWCWMGRKKAVVCVLSPEYLFNTIFCLVRFVSLVELLINFFVVVVRLAYKKKHWFRGGSFFLLLLLFQFITLFCFFYWIWFMMVITHTHTHTIDAWMVFFFGYCPIEYSRHCPHICKRNFLSLINEPNVFFCL